MLHVNDKYVNLLDTCSQKDFTIYQKLLEFSATVSYERMELRMTQLRTIVNFVLQNFDFKNVEKFIDIEKYIYENSEALILSQYTVQNWKHIDPNFISKYLTIHVKDLTGGSRDKIMKLLKEIFEEPIQGFITEDDLNNYKNESPTNWTYSNLINKLKQWYSYKEEMAYFGYTIENLKTLKSLDANFQMYKESYEFVKLMKPELAKSITSVADKKIVFDFVKWSKTNFKDKNLLKDFAPMFEQSHHYTNVALFCDDIKDFAKKNDHKALVKKLESSKCPIVYDGQHEIICEVQNTQQIAQVGAGAWCITRSTSQWDNYVTSNSARFFIYYDTNEKSSTKKMIGFAVANEKVISCQNFDNQPTSFDLKKYPALVDYLRNGRTVSTKKTIVDPTTGMPTEVHDFFSDDFARRMFEQDRFQKASKMYEYKDYVDTREVNEEFQKQRQNIRLMEELMKKRVADDNRKKGSFWNDLLKS